MMNFLSPPRHYRDCCNESRNNGGLDKFAYAALTQQTNTLTTLLTASLFNNNRNDRRNYWDNGDRGCHHHHNRHHYDDYRYDRNSPIVIDTGFRGGGGGRYIGY